MEIVILVGLISSIAAGLACAAEHNIAERHGWGVLWRYTAGASTWLVGIVPVFAAAVAVKLTPLPVSLLLYGMTVLVIAGMGLATALCYRPPLRMPEEDELERKINRALGEK